MEIGVFKEIIAVIRREQDRRASLPADEDPNFAYYTDEAFVNELCLMLLVALRHQVEKELVRLAAGAADDGKEINGQRYQENVQELRQGRGWDWKKINARLNLESCEGYAYMEPLRLVANSYKHDPSMQPDKELLKLLELETKCAPLPESELFREALAAFVDLETSAAYCDIAERFGDLASGFLKDVRNRTKVSPVKWGPIKWTDIAL